jgi:hypothetical protein
VKSIHILARIDGIKNAPGIDVGRQRHLHQYAMNGGICIQPRDPCQQGTFTRRFGQSMVHTGDAELGASPDFVGYVNLAGRIRTDQNDRKTARPGVIPAWDAKFRACAAV